MKKIILKAAAFLLLLVCLVGITAGWLAPHNTYEKNREFISSKDDYDILLLGSSHMVMGISPMQLWAEQGLTSYNLAEAEQRLAADYWLLQLALRYHKPKLVVQDIPAIGYDEKIGNNMARLHEAFDTYPFSTTKVKAVFDLFESDSRLEFLLPLTADHNRWSMVDKSFWERKEFGTQKGCMLDSTDDKGVVRYTPMSKQAWERNDAVNEAETLSKKYLRKTIELCQANGIEILLTAMPAYEEPEKQAWINSAQEIADEYGIRFWNGCSADEWEKLGLEADADFYDNAHVNSSGAQKLTKALGNYVTENYTFPGHEEALVSKWNNDYSRYRNARQNKLLKQDTFQTYSIVLGANEMDAVILIGNHEMLTDPEMKPFWENLGADMDLVTDAVDCLVIRKGRRAELLENVHAGGTYETGCGTLNAAFTEDGSLALQMGETALMELTPDQQASDVLRLALCDPDNGQLVDYVKFYYGIKSHTSAVRGN